MNRHLILTIAFLGVFTLLQGVPDGGTEQFALPNLCGKRPLCLSAWVAQAQCYNACSFNKVRVIIYEKEWMKKDDFFNEYEEKEKSDTQTKVFEHNYVLITCDKKKGTDRYILAVGTTDRARVEAYVMPELKTKKPSLRRSLSFWHTKR